MTAFDDDPEYEAQLKDALGDEASSLHDTANAEESEEMGVFGRVTGNESGDEVLDDAPTFRMKLPPGEGQEELSQIEDDAAITRIGDDGAMSEDARSISTGDDSPSAQVR
jgi:hypothetical protein